MNAAIASDALRSSMIFLPADGSMAPLDARIGGFRILTPSNPHYWWGNAYQLDHAPRDGDFERWTRAFAADIHARQPVSTHMTFGWDGDERGVVEPFLAAGFEYFETISMAADRGTIIEAPHRNDEVGIERVAGEAWDALQSLLVETRLVDQAEADYAEFSARNIDLWRDLEAKGQGCWFCVREDERVVSALGIFAEQERGSDGRRIGRYQHVVTHRSARRRGLAGTLLAHAADHAFTNLDVDTLIIAADENDMARHLYTACGFVLRSRHRGLERGS